MSEGSPPDAIERIEKALARIEASAARAASGKAALSRRHEKLRDEVSQSVATLDAMIAKART